MRRITRDSFPRVDQAAAFLPEKARAQTSLTTEEPEIVYRGSPDSLPNPTNTIVIREKQAWQSNPAADPKGNWMKYYAFGDGSVRLHQEPDNNFEEYESSTWSPVATHNLSLPLIMTRFKFAFAGVIVVASLLAALVVQHRAQVHLRERQESMRQQDEIIRA